MKIQRGHVTEKSGAWLGHYNGPLQQVGFSILLPELGTEDKRQ